MQNVKCKIKGYRCVRTIQRRGAHCASAKGICPKNGRPAACGMSPLRACALPINWGLAGSCLPCRAGACSRRNNRKAFVSGGTKAPPYGFSRRRTATQHPDKSKFETAKGLNFVSVLLGWGGTAAIFAKQICTERSFAEQIARRAPIHFLMLFGLGKIASAFAFLFPKSFWGCGDFFQKVPTSSSPRQIKI